MAGTPISGVAFAGRVGYYVRLYGNLCAVYSFVKPVITNGAPSAVTYTKQSQSVKVMIQMGPEAANLAAVTGMIDQQSALGFVDPSQVSAVNDRDILLDDAGRYWTVHTLPDQQTLGTTSAGASTVLSSRVLLTRIVKPPAALS